MMRLGEAAGEEPNVDDKYGLLGSNLFPIIVMRTEKSALCAKGRGPLANNLPSVNVPAEAHKHRLWLQLDAPDVEHFLLDFFFQRHNIFCRCAATIHDRQRVLARDANGSARISFVE